MCVTHGVCVGFFFSFESAHVGAFIKLSVSIVLFLRCGGIENHLGFGMFRQQREGLGKMSWFIVLACGAAHHVPVDAKDEPGEGAFSCQPITRGLDLAKRVR